MRASSLEDIIRYFDSQRPLSPEHREEWDAYYTETDRTEINEIITDFINSPHGHKILFGGHSGNGKSTELNRLFYDDRMASRFSLVKFDVRDILNINDIDIVELYLVICLKILEFADIKGVPIDPYLTKEFKKLEGFFRDELLIDTAQIQSRQSSMGVEGKISAGAKIPLVRMAAAFYAKMIGQHETRKTVRTAYRPKLSELSNLINDLLLNIQETPDTPPFLIIIDGLDRALFQQAKKLFQEDGSNISMIKQASALLTVPISIIHSLASASIEGVIGPMKTLKNIRLKNRNNQQDAVTVRNRRIMEDTVLNRLEKPELISSEALELAVTYSGGVFRTIIDLTASAAVKSKVRGKERIQKKDMEDAVNEARIKKRRPLSRAHWEILLEVREHKEFLSDMDDKRLELLHGLFIIEYINNDVWTDVNPLLEEGVNQYREKRKSEENDAS